MSIEDINYLKNNSIKQSYTFLVDSGSRDRRVYPFPAEYAIDFTEPFRNVVGMEVIDVSIPKTMYNIDINNNKLFYYVFAEDEDTDVRIITNTNGAQRYDESMFNMLEIPPGDYITSTFLASIRSIMFNSGIDLDINAVDIPPELTNKIVFRSTRPFVLDMHRSTMSEFLGFDLHTSDKDVNKYTFKDYNRMEGFEKIYHSIFNENGLHQVFAPGMMYIIGNKYLLLKCPEIEQHLYRSLAYSKYSMGLAKIRVNSYGFNDEKTLMLKVPLREFHPIGKLSKITLRFETLQGELYDFKGVNHNLVFAIYYYEPKQENIISKSILNPEYNHDFGKYLYKQEEQEGESDEDEEDFSRDNIELFKRRELQYNVESVANKNKSIAYDHKKMVDEREQQLLSLTKKVQGASIDSDDSE